MSKPDFQILGAERVVRNLSKMTEEMFDNVVDAVEAVQAKVVNEARRIVPKITHNLEASIQAGDVTVTDKNVVAIVEANAAYASYVEGVPDEEGRYGRGRKTPYLRPALNANLATFRRAIMAAVKR